MQHIAVTLTVTQQKTALHAQQTVMNAQSKHNSLIKNVQVMQTAQYLSVLTVKQKNSFVMQTRA